MAEPQQPDSGIPLHEQHEEELSVIAGFAAAGYHSDDLWNACFESCAADLAYRNVLDTTMKSNERVKEAYDRLIVALDMEAALQQQQDDLQYIIDHHDVTTSQMESLSAAREMATKRLIEQKNVSEPLRTQMVRRKVDYLVRCELVESAFHTAKTKHEKVCALKPSVAATLGGPSEPKLPVAPNIPHAH